VVPDDDVVSKDSRPVGRTIAIAVGALAVAAAVTVPLALGTSSRAEEQLVAAIEASDGNSVSLATAFDVDADRVGFVCPYTSPAALQEHWGVTWRGMPDYSLEDTSVTLAFERAGSVVRSAQLPLDRFDLCSSEHSDGLKPADEPVDFEQRGETWVLR
jgi:hypothetical protein